VVGGLANLYLSGIEGGNRQTYLHSKIQKETEALYLKW
jgi:hypothetical protein